jgi:hypothetical protein
VSHQVAQYISALSDELRALGSSVEGTSLYLLRAIETTVDQLGTHERLAAATAEISGRLAKRVESHQPEPGQYLDPNDEAINAFETAYKGLEEALPGMLLHKAAIDKDDKLDGDQRELLHIAYDRCMSALAYLIEQAKNLRAAVIMHDLAAEPRPQPGTTLQEVLSDLRTLPN